MCRTQRNPAIFSQSVCVCVCVCILWYSTESKNLIHRRTEIVKNGKHLFWPVILSFVFCLLFLDNLLQVNPTQKNVTVLENEWMTLECLVTNRSSRASQLSVEWYWQKSGHPEKEAIVKLSRHATLLFGALAAQNDLKSRMRLESPSAGLYLLTIQNMTVQDSGAYNCRVEEWLLDPTNIWYKRAEDLSGLTMITVKQPGKVFIYLEPFKQHCWEKYSAESNWLTAGYYYQLWDFQDQGTKYLCQREQNIHACAIQIICLSNTC